MEDAKCLSLSKNESMSSMQFVFVQPYIMLVNKPSRYTIACDGAAVWLLLK